MTTVSFSSEPLTGNPMASGLENLSAVLEPLLDRTYVRGRTALIKPNMVDPAIPQACTNPSTIEYIASALRQRGAARVLVGDEPAAYVYELASRRGAGLSIRQAYRDLGYDQVPGIELLDLPSSPALATTSYPATVFHALNGREMTINIPIRDTTPYLLINCTLPKHHGNFNYSGATKNLMGLVPHNQRIPFFHQSFFKEARDSLRREGVMNLDHPMIQARAVLLAFGFSARYQDFLSRSGADPETGLARRVQNDLNAGRLDTNSFLCHMEHIVNAGAITGLAEHIHATNPDAIHLIDGTALLTHHEHDGTPERTDFATAGTNSAHVDLAAAEKLRISRAEIPYLEQLREIWGDPVVRGTIGTSYPEGGSLIPKAVFTDRHGLQFLRIR